MKSKNEDKNIIMPLIILILIIIAITFAIVAGYNRSLYKEAIKQGAKNTVTALEMVVACQQLSNVTSEQIAEQFKKTFINKHIDIQGGD
jgi:Na+-transporting NADH:ubiquinone oxidoreductase subunit NqrC